MRAGPTPPPSGGPTSRGACFRQSLLHADPPWTCIPVTGDYQSKLHADVRSPCATTAASGCRRRSEDRLEGVSWLIAEADRDYYLERMYPAFGNLCPRDIASRAAGRVCDEGRGVGEKGLGVYLDFADAISRLGEDGVRERYGNLFDIYHEITNENAYQVPMRIFPAVHYTMGGLWVDYNLMSNLPGLFVLGEANYSDHGANRLGASALMQGLADGYFVIPYTIGDYLATCRSPAPARRPTGPSSGRRRPTSAGSRPDCWASRASTRVSHFTTSGSGHILLAGLRHDRATGPGLEQALREIPALREEFWRDRARASATDATPQPVPRGRGPGGRFSGAGRTHSASTPSPDGGELRMPLSRRAPSIRTANASATTPISRTWLWRGEYQGEGRAPARNVEPLTYEFVKMRPSGRTTNEVIRNHGRRDNHLQPCPSSCASGARPDPRSPGASSRHTLAKQSEPPHVAFPSPRCSTS